MSDDREIASSAEGDGDVDEARGRDVQAPAEGVGPSSVAEELRALKAVLHRTGRRLEAPVLVEGALWYGVTLLAVVLAGLALAFVGGDTGYLIARWIIGVGTALATVGGLAAGGVFWMGRPGAEQIAARIQRHSPVFRSDLVAALEFGQILVDAGAEALAEKGCSPAMARAHLSQTLGRVRQESDDHSLAHLVPTRGLTPPILALSGGLVLLAIPLVLNPGWTLGVITAERAGAPVVGERVIEEQIVGAVDGVFVYPRYTGLDRHMRDLGTGYLESLAGTEVHLRAHLMPRDWASVTMVVETEEESQEIAMTLREGHRASATLHLSDDGYYWFKGQTLAGRPVEDRRKRRIRAIEDEAPRVEITSHQGRVEVQPEEVITLAVEVADDFGLESLQRVMYFQGGEADRDVASIDAAALASYPSSHETTYRLDLGPLNLQPKDGVVIYFEARDNNTTTGPGVGESDHLLLYVESPQDKHLRNLARQQEVLEKLLGHLADFLESPVGERVMEEDGTYRQRVDGAIGEGQRIDRYERTRHLHQRRRPILEAFDEVVERLEDDPIVVPRTKTLIQGLHRQVQRLHEDGDALFGRLSARASRRELTAGNIQSVADYAARVEEELEKGLLSLDDLLASQKMDLIKATAQELEELRDRLRGLLEDYRETEDPELRQAIEREMQRLRHRMQELMERMQMQMRQMPREHVNMEALEQLQMESRAQDLGADMDAIEGMFNEGDIDGALEALEQMEFDLGDLSGDMGDSFAQMQPAGLSQLDEAVSEMMDEVNQLREMEQELEERTRQLQQALQEERRERLQEMLEPFIDELMEQVRAQQDGLKTIEDRPISQQDRSRLHRAVEEVDGLQEMLAQQDLEQALERAGQSSRALRAMRSTMNLSQRYASERSSQGQAIRQSLRDSAPLIERGRVIEERLEAFMEQAQQDLAPEEEQRFDELAQEQSQIRQRAEQLRQQIGDMSEQYPVLQEELMPSLEEADEAMGQAEQSLGERRTQRALDQERQAIESLGQLGNSMQNALERQRQEERDRGQSVGDNEEVEIPSQDDGEMRERLRQEMMEGMRDGRIEAYESQIERYFRSLVE